MKSLPSQPKYSIKHHLVGLVMIAVIPVVFFAAGLIVYLAKERSAALEDNLLSTTRALNVAIDEQIVSVVSSLKILSEVEGFHPDSIQFLHKRLKTFVKNQQGWSFIALTDTQGTQILNTSSNFGMRLPRLNRDNSFKRMLKTGETIISGYREGESIITVSVPVKKNGYTIYALVGAIDLKALTDLLKTQTLPKNWSASILDSNAKILAHSRNPSFFVGKIASKQLSEKILWKGSSVFKDTNKDGKKFFGATSHSKITDWTIVLKVSDDGHLFTYWKSVSLAVIGGSLFLFISIAFALLMGRKISRPILALSQSAQSLGEGKAISELQTSLSEIQIVNHALKEAALQRNLNEEKIQEAVNLRDTFLSVASHELKTPITTLKLQFQFLDRIVGKKEFILKEDLIKPFSRVQDQIRRLTLLIDDLLDVTRINSGKMEYHQETFDIVPFINDVAEQFEGEAAKVGVEIIIDGEDSLIGCWDKDRLEQVLVNLVTNALKYGNSQPIHIRIARSETDVVISVKDRGIGITPENLSRIFERYERVADDRQVSGLGLGLWIVKKIVEGLGGDITVTSQYGEGSIFTLNLPLTTTHSETVRLNLIVNQSHELTQ
jgi:signal transduction histidine kinase